MNFLSFLDVMKINNRLKRHKFKVEMHLKWKITCFIVIVAPLNTKVRE